MKLITNKLAEVLLTLAAIGCCIGVIAFTAPHLSGFFGSLVQAETEKSEEILESIETPDLSGVDEPAGEIESGEAYALIFDNSADSTNALPLIFVLEEEPVVAGDTYNSEVYGEITVKYAYTDFVEERAVPWATYRSKITSVVVEDAVAPKSVNGWFQSFSACTAMNLAKLDTSKCTDMAWLFAGCNKLTELDVSTFKTENVTDMSDMFYKCSSLTELDLSNFDTSKVESMSLMFSLSSKLERLDLSGFDTSSLTKMYSMFHTCSGLQSITFGEKWDVSAVEDLSFIFYKCAALTEIDISGWDTSKATNMGRLFGECTTLTSITFGSGWDTSNVTTMTQMFYKDAKLTLDCSGWDVANVTSRSSFNASAPGVTAPTWAS